MDLLGRARAPSFLQNVALSGLFARAGVAYPLFNPQQTYLVLCSCYGARASFYCGRCSVAAYICWPSQRNDRQDQGGCGWLEMWKTHPHS
ncbi:hypothetical protein BCV70DRAFT_30876 [Testicularia cyperi]|uniref:Uncharacterized protein n=1 Tax=Testicularia cyperi TaxID=1882483 RepID=A0A317XNE4_9BASI|nr:hypothetical protein BCV70DRAFT_30876 [Testicularia cyperi]